MQFRFIGPDSEAPTRIVFRGYAFELNGSPVDVTDSASIRKLTGHRGFECLGDETAYADGVIVEAERDILEANLRTAITAKGGTFDGRWGVKRLREALEALDG